MRKVGKVDSFEMLFKQPPHHKWQDLALICSYNWSYIAPLKPHDLFAHMDEELAETLDDSFKMLFKQP